ncbi:MAG: hypothetical protein Q8K79_07185 [Solirubrobacteraceae bacterium]|nr:hypothetical protein [Solirubrobacteraceae bacterium]
MGRLTLRLALVGTLVAGALALWLSASGPGYAATETQTQSMGATVLTTLAWGSAGTCVQSMPAVDFGNVTPGVHKSAPASGQYTGCVTSSMPFSATAAGSAAMTSGANTIPWSGVFIYQQMSTWVATAGACVNIESCPLSTPVSLATNAPAQTGKALSFTYGVKPPPTQPAGTYTGGVVTFTASN